MIKAKQKTVRIFDIKIKDSKDFFPYMDKNLILLKEYMLVISGDITTKITKYLEGHNICFIIAEDCNLNIKSKSNSATNSDIMPKNYRTRVNNGKQRRNAYISMGLSFRRFD
jgi:septum site-determining protein MinC